MIKAMSQDSMSASPGKTGKKKIKQNDEASIIPVIGRSNNSEDGDETLPDELLAGDENIEPVEVTDAEPVELQAEEWQDVSVEDPLEILGDPSMAVELSEDPVRLYLKEI